MRRGRSATMTAEAAGLVCRSYRLQLASLDVEARSVEAVIATEEPVLVFDWSRFELVLESLRMDGLRTAMGTRVPLCDAHNAWTTAGQLGSTELLRIEGGQLIGRNTFSAAESVQDAWTKVREGHITDNSVGYIVRASVMLDAGTTESIGGRQYSAPTDRPLRVVTEWEIRENSICPIGADAAAKMRAAHLEARHGKESTMTFDQWLQKRGLSREALSEEQATALRATYEAEVAQSQRTEAPEADPPAKKPEGAQRADNPPSAPPAAEGAPAVDPAQIARQATERAIADERQRVREIRQVAGQDIDADVVRRAIDEGMSVDQAQRLFLQHLRARNLATVGSPAVIVRDERATMRTLGDAILLRSGNMESVLLAEPDGEKRAHEAERYRTFSLVDLCRTAVRLTGKDPDGLKREEMIRAAFSTTTLPKILGEVVNKGLMFGYNASPATWRAWCHVAQAPDFKTMTKLRATAVGQLEQVGSGGEVKQMGMEEEYEEYKIATYAANFGLSRQQIIDDDADVLTRVPMMLGQAAFKRLMKLVYTTLLANGTMADGSAIFVSGHSNLNTSSALADATLAAAIATFQNQVDKNGDPIDLVPSVLLVPPALHRTARELAESAALIITGTTDAVRGVKNINADWNLKVVAEPRLQSSAYTGYSTTTWYLMGDPAICDNLHVAFLDGIQAPTLETLDPGPNALGTVWRVYFDFGCGAVDFRTMVKNTA